MTGSLISWEKVFTGGASIVFLILALPFLERRFSGDRSIPSKAVQNQPAILTETNLLQIGLGFLAISVFFIVFLLIRQSISISSLLILFLIFVLIICITVPPVRLIKYGMGEIAIAILLANLISGFGFFLQSDQYSKLLLSITLPLTLLLLASEIAVSLEQYGKDQPLQTRMMVDVIGWQRGMLLHDSLILFAFVLTGIFGVLVQPWRITWPGLLTLPIGLFEIWQMWRIARGAKPNWKLLKLTANAMIFLAVYFMALTAWIR